MRRTLRAGALQDAWHGARGQPGRFRQVAGGSGGRETVMATSATIHSHAPQGFIRTQLLSLDHKVIGIQYFFLALTAVVVGRFSALLMRMHMSWPRLAVPLIVEVKPETYDEALTLETRI